MAQWMRVGSGVVATWLLMGLAVPGTAWAERPENTLPRFEVTSFGGYRIGGEFDLEDDQGAPLDDAELDESFSWGLGLGVYRDAFGYYELLYARQSTEFDSRIPDVGDVDITTEYYQFGGTLLFDYEPWLLPYLSLTIGLTRFDAGRLRVRVGVFRHSGIRRESPGQRPAVPDVRCARLRHPDRVGFRALLCEQRRRHLCRAHLR